MKRRLFILMMLLVALTTGCQRRPLELATANLTLRLNLHLKVKVNGKFEELPKPEMMRVMFYDPETYQLITESYLPPEGGTIAVPPGKYKFIAYNFDTEATLIKHDRDYLAIEAYTNDVTQAQRSSILNSIRNAVSHAGGSSNTKSGAEDSASSDESETTENNDWTRALQEISENRIIYEPDHLFVSREDVEVLNITGEQVIEATAESIIETWQIRIKMSNARYFASAKSLLTGQIASNRIGYPKEEGKTDTDVILMFDMGSEFSEEGEWIVGTFNTFGKNPHRESLLLTIIIKTQSGETIEWHRDITGEFFTEQARETQVIELEDVIDIPAPSQTGGGGGFQPQVDDWDEENIPINI